MYKLYLLCLIEMHVLNVQVFFRIIHPTTFIEFHNHYTVLYSTYELYTDLINNATLQSNNIHTSAS